MFISCLFFFSSKVQNHCSSPSHTSPLEMIPPGITHLWTHHTLFTDIPFTVPRNHRSSAWSPTKRQPPIQCMKSHEESSTHKRQCSNMQQQSVHNQGQIRVYLGNDTFRTLNVFRQIQVIHDAYRRHHNPTNRRFSASELPHHGRHVFVELCWHI